jgi:hypothetical protein
MTDVNVFTDPFELGELSTLPLVRSRGRGRIKLSGRMAAHQKAAEWERELNRYYFACGCDTGAKGTLIGLAGAAVLLIDSLVRGWFGWTRVILLSLALIIVLSVMGKFVGLFRANHRLNRLIREIQQQMPPERAEPAPVLLCG